jgi:nitric oxide synthase oxygenase domain/subunit
MTFECSWEEFKHRVRRFMDAAPSLNHSELDNMFKALSLSYLGMRDEMWRDSAAVALNMAVRVHMKRERELEVIE